MDGSSDGVFPMCRYIGVASKHAKGMSLRYDAIFIRAFG